MHTTQEPKILTRDCEAVMIPAGNKVTLQQGEEAHITQALGGTYTVIVNGNMFRIEGKDADALGIKQEAAKSTRESGKPLSQEELEKEVWNQMRSCYDPEIPVNIVDLGLIYDCKITPVSGGGGYEANVKMTLTAPGCGMGDYLKQDVQNKILSIEGIDSAEVELVWEPQWNQGMMTDAAKLQLGLY